MNIIERSEIVTATSFADGRYAESRIAGTVIAVRCVNAHLLTSSIFHQAFVGYCSTHMEWWSLLKETLHEVLLQLWKRSPVYFNVYSHVNKSPSSRSVVRHHVVRLTRWLIDVINFGIRVDLWVEVPCKTTWTKIPNWKKYTSLLKNAYQQLKVVSHIYTYNCFLEVLEVPVVQWWIDLESTDCVYYSVVSSCFKAHCYIFKWIESQFTVSV